MRPVLAVMIALSAALAAPATAQDASPALRASGQAGEQADGYLGIVGNAGPATHAQVDGVNAKRRAYYVELAARRGATINEVAAVTACELFRSKVGAGQFYRLPDGVWRQREDAKPIPLPDYCG